MSKERPDVFDRIGRKLAEAAVDTLLCAEGLTDEQFKAGAVMAMEEFYFRVTGFHLDWQRIKNDPSIRGRAKNLRSVGVQQTSRGEG